MPAWNKMNYKISPNAYKYLENMLYSTSELRSDTVTRNESNLLPLDTLQLVIIGVGYDTASLGDHH